MAYLHNSRCYSSQAEADAANWGAVPPAIGSGKLTTVSFSGSGWYISNYDISSGAPALVSTALAPVVSYPACDPMESFNDGQTVGMGIAVAMILAFVIRIQGWATR